MNRCASDLLEKAVADLGPNGITKFAASAGVSVSTLTLCLGGNAPKKLTTRVAIASAAGLKEPELFPIVDSPDSESAEDEAG